MADTQHSGSSSSGGQQKTQLSWGQPSTQNASSRPAAPATVQPMATESASSRLVGVFVAGLIIGLLIAWAWFDLRNTQSSTSAIATSTDQFAITQTTGNTASSATTSNAQTTAASSAPTVVAQPAGTQATQSGAPSGMAMSGAAITLGTSQPAGYSVQVSSITAGSPVWAVVYANADRTGEILGAARFGATKSGTITLMHATTAGRTYYVGLVADTASHTYSPSVNQPIMGDDGSPVMTQFTAQ